MISGKDLKPGDVVYDSNCGEWNKPDAWRDEGDWQGRVAMEIQGEIYLTSFFDRPKGNVGPWRTVHCERADRNRLYGETPHEAIRADASSEIDYHAERLAFFKEVFRLVCGAESEQLVGSATLGIPNGYAPQPAPSAHEDDENRPEFPTNLI